jgi:hypothetical protein
MAAKRLGCTRGNWLSRAYYPTPHRSATERSQRKHRPERAYSVPEPDFDGRDLFREG